MRVSGRRAYTREVPGTCNIGKMGVTFDYPQVGAGGKRPYIHEGVSKRRTDCASEWAQTHNGKSRGPVTDSPRTTRTTSHALVSPCLYIAETPVYFSGRTG